MNSIRKIKLVSFFSFLLISACRPVEVNSIDTSKTEVLNKNYAKGADIGWLSEMEVKGKKFYTNDGIEHDLFDVLKSKGINSVRFRIWVNPSNGYCNKADVIAMAIRAHQKGMRIMLDFHYSDTWATVDREIKPNAWKNYGFAQLQQAVYDHTLGVLNTLKSDGVTPEWVQVGNESDDGILFPDGQISLGNGANFAKLFKSGYDAIKSIDANIKVIAHASSSNDTTHLKAFFDALYNNGAHWDVIGLSSYPGTNAPWQLRNDHAFETMTFLQKRYQKPIMMCETGYLVTAPLECKNMLIDLMKKNSSLGENGLGVFYWEPASDLNWNLKYKYGAFDTKGKPTEAMDAFLIK
jgi:arabinogalactan endo-1,4-beta-galactosidase